MIYGYCRVSTAKQAEDGDSLGAQERTVKGYAMMKGMDTPLMYTDANVSGSTHFNTRPEGTKLMALLAKGDILIVPKLDRAFRSALDALQVLSRLKELGVGLHILDLGGDVTEGMGKLMFTIAAAFAEGERDRIRERNKDSIKDRRAKGKWLGGIIPWGHELAADNQLVALPGTAPAIDAMRTLRGQGMSLRRVAEEMRRRGVPISHEKVRQAIAA